MKSGESSTGDPEVELDGEGIGAALGVVARED